MKIKIPTPISGGLILSYKCNASCRHCMYACCPQWPAHWINDSDLQKILSQLARTIQPSPFGPEAVTLSHGLYFTGGEPFLNFELLLQATQIAREFNIPSTFVETNAFWCINDTVTREKLQALKDAGIKGIMISVNPFYLEYVPFERTRRCVEISLEIFGHNTMIYQLEFFRRFHALNIKGKFTLDEYIQREGNSNILRHAEFFMMGRAPYRLSRHLSPYFRRHSPEFFFRQPCVPEFLREWHNHFDNYGNYMPGFCGGLTLGDCRKLDTLLSEGIELDHFPILAYIVADDFAGLFHYATERGYHPPVEGYLSKCHLCVDIRKFLVETGEYAELQPREFYRYLH
ncbi:MAG: radical SAM protein [Calditrichia bacterium]